MTVETKESDRPALNEAQLSLTRMQEFDVTKLPRTDELGTQMNFETAIEPATRLINLYKQLPERSLRFFPDDILGKIKARANGDYHILEEILSFNSAQPDPSNVREQLLVKLESAYGQAFMSLYPWISYSVRVTTDLTRLESDARGIIQTVNDEAAKMIEHIKKLAETAEVALQDIRKTAAEQGVTQQAIYFKEESDSHMKSSQTWLKGTIITAILLALIAMGSLFLHLIPVLAPETIQQSIQLAVSKGLVFAVISYLLFLCVRSYLSHRHNAIVNKHRQNALQTYKTLVDAAQEMSNQDIILTEAARCIFTPQGTGFTRDPRSGGAGSASIVEILTKVAQTASET